MPTSRLNKNDSWTNISNSTFTRRAIVLGTTAAALVGCTTATPPAKKIAISVEPTPVAPLMYAALPDEPFPIPAVEIGQINQRFWRQDVDYETSERIGTLVVDTPNKFLYHVGAGGRAPAHRRG